MVNKSCQMSPDVFALIQKSIRIHVPSYKNSVSGWVTLRFLPETTVSQLHKQAIEAIQAKHMLTKDIDLSCFRLCTAEKKIELPKNKKVLSFLKEIGDRPSSIGMHSLFLLKGVNDRFESTRNGFVRSPKISDITINSRRYARKISLEKIESFDDDQDSDSEKKKN